MRPELYINRELSALAFIRRVFKEAQDERHPLLERVRFLGFVNQQLDDFFMVRISGLQEQQLAQVTTVGPDGMLPGQQLDALRERIRVLLRDQYLYLTGQLLPELAAEGVAVLDYAQLTPEQQTAAAVYFRQEVFPVLTPLGVDTAHPFPHISNRSLNLAVTLRDPENGQLFARVKVPSSTLKRLIPVPPASSEASAGGDAPHSAFVWLDQALAAHLGQLFPGLEVLASYPFRVLRDADFEIQQDLAGDLLETVEQGVQTRRFGAVVNLMVSPDMPMTIREWLRENLELSESDVMIVEGPLALGDLGELTDLDRPDLKYPPLVGRTPPELSLGQDIFTEIAQGDALLHHPYDAFGVFERFIEAAADDPQVLAIKQTLYRVGSNSRIVDALLRANDQGKQVAVLVEIKARFDEESNIEWARTLEREGVHVVYGQVALKTHAKVALVVRREAEGLRRYVHLGTGNYNASTARVYEDVGLLTCRADIGEDATNLFNALTGFARGIRYSTLLVAPNTLRAGLLRRIEREIARHRATGKGRLIFKANGLVDPEFVRALYRASQAGVEIDLIIRGMCCLRPGVPGVSDHIRVVSLVGRFLEHSRLYYFANGGEGDDEILMGSADLMPRNLDHRVETLVPVEDPTQRAYLRDVVLPVYLRDTANAHRLNPDGTYTQLSSLPGVDDFDAQVWFAQHSPTDPAAALGQLADHPGNAALDLRERSPLSTSAPLS